MLKEITFSLKGKTALMLNNGALANPMNPLAIKLKELTDKRTKTLRDHQDIAHLQFIGSFYWNKKTEKFILPETCIEAGLKTSVSQVRKNSKKLVESAIVVYESGVIWDDGPKNPEARWDAGETYRDQRMVVIGKKRVLRTRPLFHDWNCVFVVHFDDTKIDSKLVKDTVIAWGDTVGMLELRPKYGRFEVIDAEEK